MRCALWFLPLSITLLAGLGSASDPAVAADFLDAIQDVPLMEGLIETSDEDVTFDVPEGRIVTAEASGQPSVDKVLAFYARTLPQLGWTQAGETTFRRDGETLTLEAERTQNTTHLTFRLSPQPE
jgi:hypothetical protein